jgi:hypothetical protein
MTEAMKQFNAAIEEFDKRTGFDFDSVTDLQKIADYCKARGWHDLSKTILESITK